MIRRPAAKTPPVLAFAVASFSTTIDIFGPMAIGPALAASYHTLPGRIGVVLSSSAAGMALAGVATALLADHLGRKTVMVGALLLLAVPTACLALAPALGVFALLRMAQGILMCMAFTMAIAFAAETWGPGGWAPVLMASYVTGNVASNMLGRVVVGLLTAAFGWRIGFLTLACLNVLGGLALGWLLPAAPGGRADPAASGRLHVLGQHLSDAKLLATYAIGFLLMFDFFGVFTYVNFRLASPPISLSSAGIGLLYVVFAPALASTPQAGRCVRLLGHRFALLIGCVCALAGIVLTAAPWIVAILAGLSMFGAGIFFCHAVASAFAGVSAAEGKLASGGLYLTFYSVGGLCGAIVMGAVFGALGWGGCVTVAAGAVCLVTAVSGLAGRAGRVDAPGDLGCPARGRV